MSIIQDKIGHRTRLRERLLKSSHGQMPDYEILELLLCMAQPRKDMKPLAKELINNFGSFSKVIFANYDDLIEIKGVGQSIISTFKIIQESASRLLMADFRSNSILQSWDALINYCKATMSHLDIEQFRVLYLDQKNMVIADIIQSQGTIDHVTIYPREIIKKALHLNASSLVLVHNHPSGSLKPSKPDIQLTQQINKAAEVMNILIHDHIIVSDKGYYSFRENKLL
jgi:DNA repair protein RadC